jgi:hypothetical protein
LDCFAIEFARMREIKIMLNNRSNVDSRFPFESRPDDSL